MIGIIVLLTSPIWLPIVVLICEYKVEREWVQKYGYKPGYRK